MFYTEIASKDAMHGVIVISETIEGVLKDILEWVDETESPLNLEPAELRERETNKKIGTIMFDEDKILIQPV